MRTRLGVLAAVLLSGLLVVACGDDDGGGPDPSGNDDAARLLEEMVLTAGQLLPGLEQASTALSTNEDLAAAAVNPEGELGRLKAFGRILGYEVQFVPGQDAPADLRVSGVQESVSLFETASGAAQSLADGLAAARTTDWEAAHSDLKGVNVAELPVPTDAGEGAWFRIAGADNGGNLVIDDQVAFRVENVRVFVRVALLLPPGTPVDAFQDQTEGWVILAAQRIRDALTGVPGESPTG
jgi:hypothetical protein